MGIKFDDEVHGIASRLLNYIESWEIFRTSFSNSTLDGVISIDFSKRVVFCIKKSEENHKVHYINSQMFCFLSLGK